MLQRVQLLLDQETRVELKKLAAQKNISMSEAARKILQQELAKKRQNLDDGGGAFLIKLARTAVKGPGDSDYDKYAYGK